MKNILLVLSFVIYAFVPTYSLAIENVTAMDSNEVSFGYEVTVPIITSIVAFVIAIVSLAVNFIMNKKVNFINTITAERIKWLDKIRHNISEFCGFTHHWTDLPPKSRSRC